MKIRNLHSWAGLDFSFAPDEIIDLPDDIAQARIDAGLAEVVKEKKPLSKLFKPEAEGIE